MITHLPPGLFNRLCVLPRSVALRELDRELQRLSSQPVQNPMKTYDLHQAAEILHLHPDTLQRRAKAGQIRAAKPGKNWVFRKDILAGILSYAGRHKGLGDWRPGGRTPAALGCSRRCCHDHHPGRTLRRRATGSREAQEAAAPSRFERVNRYAERKFA